LCAFEGRSYHAKPWFAADELIAALRDRNLNLTNSRRSERRRVVTNASANIIHLLAPAKVNLTLAVLGRRPDGFHEIESLVVRIALCDELSFSVAESLSLSVDGDGAIAADQNNLVWKAATALASESKCAPKAAIRLVKRIPSGAGLGGGSSDAAMTLLGLNSLWSLDWPIERLSGVAAALGSDVPLFLESESVIIRGRGERIQRAQACAGWLVLIIPMFTIATATVYRAWRESDRVESDSRLSEVLEKMKGDTTDWISLLFNDLEPAAFSVEPRLADLHRRLDGLLGRTVRMTGSGSCLFSLFDSEPAAGTWKIEAEKQLQADARAMVVRIL
jgi:4-diphosphocytidyl-2-C-methyl-D-erythritol kinase